MRLASLSIHNFRGVREGHLWFSRHNVFVGANNCGKTTVIEALALLFGRDRLVRNLTEHDFYGGNPVAADRVRLTASIIGFDGQDPAKYPQWFGPERAVPKWIDRASGDIFPEPKDEKSLLTCQVGFAARFDRPSIEVETARYFVDDETIDVFADESYRHVPSRLLKDVGFFLVPASRTWDRVISFSSELFRRVVTAGDGIPSQAILHERDRLRSPEHPVETDSQIEPIIRELNKELSGFFQSAPRLSLRVTATDSESVLDSLVPHFAHGPDGYALPARRHGTGLISMQSLLLLLQFGKRRTEAGQGFWMALEEPELHIPPPLQRRLVQRLQSLSAQTFITSHSPVVAGISDPRALQVLRNVGGTLSSIWLNKATSQPDDANAVRTLFELHRQETIAALMHDAILIPEGRTDGELLELLGAAVDAKHTWSTTDESRFAAHVGVIRTKDAAVVATFRRLQPMHPSIVCLVDGDASGKSYLVSLASEPMPPPRALRWSDGWTIEDVIGWVMEAGPIAVESIVDISPPARAVRDLVERLKSSDRGTGGLKQDRRAYESIAETIAAAPLALIRARELLNAITDEALGISSSLFVDEVSANGRVLVRVLKT